MNRRGGKKPAPPAEPRIVQSGTQNRRQGPRGLNQRQHRFVREFLLDPTRNAAQAYLRAGYMPKNSYVASVNASRLLNDARVQAELQRVSARLEKKIEARAADIIDRWMKQAFVDATDLFVLDERGRWILRPNAQLDAATRSAITRVVITAKGDVRVDISARDAALDALARHLGLFKQGIALTGPDGQPLVPIEAVRALIREADAAEAAGVSPEPLPAGAPGD